MRRRRPDTSTNASWSWLSAWRSAGSASPRRDPRCSTTAARASMATRASSSRGSGWDEVQGGQLVELQRLLADHEPGGRGQQLLAGGLDLAGVLLGGGPFLGRQLAVGPGDAGRPAGGPGCGGAGVDGGGAGRRPPPGRSTGCSPEGVQRLLMSRDATVRRGRRRRRRDRRSPCGCGHPPRPLVPYVGQLQGSGVARAVRSGVCAPTRPRFVRPGSIGRSGAARRGRRLPRRPFVVFRPVTGLASAKSEKPCVRRCLRIDEE